MVTDNAEENKKNFTMNSEVKMGAIKTYDWCRMKVDFQIAIFNFSHFYKM